jgi:hypothetical protein
MNKLIEAIMVGSGRRGIEVFGKFALDYPKKLKFAAVIDPNTTNREFFANQHQISKENCFSTVNHFLDSEPKIKIAINATPDREHYNTTKKLLENEFHVLLEKPIALNLNECYELEKLAKEKKVHLIICHILRYTPFFKKIKKLLGTEIGVIKNIKIVEDIGQEHFVHSYVRGNWNNSKVSGPISLTKTCHDFDIIIWLLNYRKCKQLNSYSPQLKYSPENSPKQVPDYCLGGCWFKDNCPHYAPQVYLGPTAKRRRQRAVATSLDTNEILENLKLGPYGRCVYRCDNNVPNTQITNMLFEDNITAQLFMVVDEEESTRKVEIVGSQGKIYGNLIKGKITLIKEDKEIVFDIKEKGDTHGGGDYALIENFLRSVSEELISKENSTNITNSIQSHGLALKAEQSRKVFNQFTHH